MFDETQIDEQSGECREEENSELWIIDAKGMKDVVARIRLPQWVPYGFHGAWFDEEEVLGQRGLERIGTVQDKEGSKSGFWEG